ncbi:prepilin-type N-terminal cleavage/methylation domain-containing protein [Catenuloplanes atrovinosus]|uniref:Type IV pilus assembly protein PilA n=1 Tax=Catenuloplanes atrovinosus TaxID=137266 RepID=A0AAE3YJG2_9ACTN|nr:prepilin-type N-terminal cleavage/methylation domain-containing protein [Catenuloplanes atrovinosus]MDR7274625.1 type IV pilus assembly protein PilA [Catenuloplanes atrovinosus]
MQHLIAKSQQKRAESDKGFTLIELLVVVVIIGILVAIAVPVYLNYRKGASNKSAQSDVRAAISAVEQFYTENGNKYPVDASATAPTALALQATAGTAGPRDQKANLSSGNEMQYDLLSATNYVICARNVDGGQIYVYNNATGGSVRESSAADLAACITAG